MWAGLCYRGRAGGEVMHGSRPIPSVCKQNSSEKVSDLETTREINTTCIQPAEELGITGKSCRPATWPVGITLKGQGGGESEEENARAEGAFASVKFWLRTGIPCSIWVEAAS